jgi:hypothetical protein
MTVGMSAQLINEDVPRLGGVAEFAGSMRWSSGPVGEAISAGSSA